MNEELIGVPERQICDYAVGFSLDTVPERIKKSALRAFCDTIGAMVTGASMEQLQCSAAAIDADLEKSGSVTDPIILGIGHTAASYPDAALLNGVSGHSCEYNDLFWQLPGHPSAVLVPVVLGMGQKYHLCGKKVFEAYILGFEILARINKALMPAHHIKGFHSTSSAGIIGAAVAAGKLLELDADKMRNALSIACTFACGLRANFGHLVNSLHVGNAAANGMRAALLARAGIDANTDLLSLADGYMAAFDGDVVKLCRMTGELGKVWAFESPGLLIKKYPTCFSTYQAIDAAVEIKKKSSFSAEDIASVKCLTSPNSMMSLPMIWPHDIFSQRYCVPLCVLAVLTGNTPSAEYFAKYHADDKELCLLKDRLEYAIDPAQTDDTGFGYTDVYVTLKDGRDFSARAYPNPKERVECWTEEKLTEKFHDCCDAILGYEQSLELMEALKTIENTQDINTILEKTYKKGI